MATQNIANIQWQWLVCCHARTSIWAATWLFLQIARTDKGFFHDLAASWNTISSLPFHLSSWWIASSSCRSNQGVIRKLKIEQLWSTSTFHFAGLWDKCSIAVFAMAPSSLLEVSTYVCARGGPKVLFGRMTGNYGPWTNTWNKWLPTTAPFVMSKRD